MIDIGLIVFCFSKAACGFAKNLRFAFNPKTSYFSKIPCIFSLKDKENPLMPLP